MPAVCTCQRGDGSVAADEHGVAADGRLLEDRVVHVDVPPLVTDAVERLDARPGRRDHHALRVGGEVVRSVVDRRTPDHGVGSARGPGDEH